MQIKKICKQCNNEIVASNRIKFCDDTCYNKYYKIAKPTGTACLMCGDRLLVPAWVHCVPCGKKRAKGLSRKIYLAKTKGIKRYKGANKNNNTFKLKKASDYKMGNDLWKTLTASENNAKIIASDNENTKLTGIADSDTLS